MNIEHRASFNRFSFSANRFGFTIIDAFGSCLNHDVTENFILDHFVGITVIFFLASDAVKATPTSMILCQNQLIWTFGFLDSFSLFINLFILFNCFFQKPFPPPQKFNQEQKKKKNSFQTN